MIDNMAIVDIHFSMWLPILLWYLKYSMVGIIIREFILSMSVFVMIVLFGMNLKNRSMLRMHNDKHDMSLIL